MSGTDLSGAPWRKSSYSNGQANCVEVSIAVSRSTFMSVRDSKASDGVTLIFGMRAWKRFTDTTRNNAKKLTPGQAHDTSGRRRQLPVALQQLLHAFPQPTRNKVTNEFLRPKPWSTLIR
jgi:hypothetical protein